MIGPSDLYLTILRRLDDDAFLCAPLNHANSVAVSLPQYVHVGIDNEQQEDAGDPDPEHQVRLIDEREYVRTNGIELFAVPAEQRKNSYYNSDGPHHTKRYDSLWSGNNPFVS